jgi:hypothetical protein
MQATRFAISVLSLSLVVLTVLAVAPTRHPATSDATWHVTWLFHPNSLGEARKQASAIITAQVVAVEQAADIVVPVEGEPNGEDRVPTQRITVAVLQALKGNLSQTITLFRTGTDSMAIEGDPAYQVGETYLLFVQPREDEAGIYRIIAPEGRFRVVNAQLEPMVHEGYAAAFRGKPVAALTKELEQAATRER